MKKLLIVVDVQNGFITEASKGLPERIANYIRNSDYTAVVATQYINHRDSACYQYLGWKGCVLPD